MRRTWSGAIALVMSWSVFVAAHAAGDAPPTIAVGETAAREGGPAIAGALGDALSEEIAARRDVRLTEDTRRARWVVRGSVVQLDEHAVADGLEVRCEVSLIVADARGGSVRAMLQGRAGARGVDDPERLARAALQAAVRGALRPIANIR
ncbi:hypothetical protein [Sandaracinus amylolyticus]|uniref:hypothetical protein n=1 Tax=Sandaracinus amylolyticus TaxID=927083 RepID=UPI001F48F5F1|nr:hypothetical protein [Sandaracinus amylolyticus]UJR81549.1 Hypothetical protein I5071_36090 [Sandaracinus amylolyticus]